jgi:uncharacterized protein YdiU (UPF0061 family)
VRGAFWSAVEPTPVAAPQLLAYASEVADLLDLGADDVASPLFTQVFSGNGLLPNMRPYAACYGGHQFGHWAGQLGDGRAITLGEVVNRAGQRWELQLKGAGPTPYSRTADGRAVLRSSIREFLCSEAMHHLGVPTTRALSLVATGEPVVRDMFYDGNPRPEPGAIVCRVSPSFLRFGNFEIMAAQNNPALLEQLVDFTIERDFPELPGTGIERRTHWFHSVCERTALMVAHWMRVGFVHGVMNTDNMSILGLTIDYGPYGWVDNFDPDWTPNTTDAQGRRYRFGHQPQVAQWNLICLANALVPIFPAVEPLEAGIQRYVTAYTEYNQRFTAAKFGFAQYTDTDFGLIRDVYTLLHQAEMDMTWFFRGLAEVDLTAPSIAPLEAAFYTAEGRAEHLPLLQSWLMRYAARLRNDDLSPEQRRAQMHAVNPRFVLRNYLAQQVIDQAEAGDPSGIAALLEVLRRPYDEQPDKMQYAAKRPDWARHKAGCSMLSCSS